MGALCRAGVEVPMGLSAMRGGPHGVLCHMRFSLGLCAMGGQGPSGAQCKVGWS